MKIRTGFVSNSSSSSYVIAYKEVEKCPHCGRSDVDILSLIDRSGDETSVGPMGYKEVINELDSWMFNESKNIIKKMDELNDGTYKFAIVYISYYDEALTELIKNTPSIKILYSTN